MPACSPEHSHWIWDGALRPRVMRAASCGSGGAPRRSAGILVQPLGQHPGHTSLMGRCGVVRGTGQSQLLGPKLKASAAPDSTSGTA